MAIHRPPPDRFGARTALFRTRTSVLFAADARTAVVLRRGPRLHHHLLKWDLRTDAFESGQWLKGTAHIFDLNSDGTRLLYWARQWHPSAPDHEGELRGDTFVDAHEPLGLTRPFRRAREGARRYPDPLVFADIKRLGLRPRRNEGVWTAISTPPFFTAFAIWPCFGHWTGGGYFADNRTVMLQEDARGLVPKVNVRLPAGFTMATAHAGGPVRGQRCMAQYGTPIDHRRTRFDDHALALLEAGVRWVDWFHIDGLDLLFAADGMIFRLRNHAKVALPQILDAAQCLIDLRPMRFALVKAPLPALAWRDSGRGRQHGRR
ncbi:MAG: hypothetical protein AcusKO_31530 [Acuticoccus sp.]